MNETTQAMALTVIPPLVYERRRLLATPAVANKAAPNSTIVPGSGTGATRARSGVDPTGGANDASSHPYSMVPPALPMSNA